MAKEILTNKQKIGQIGENIAVKHLKKLGYKILDRNYRKKWGEIDIIAEKNESNSIFRKILNPKKILHFIEVKSVSRETLSNPKYHNVSIETSQQNKNVSRETIAPEENITSWKKKRLSRAIRTYLLEKRVSYETKWQIDVMAVFVNLKDKKAKIRFTENVVIT